MPNPLPRLHTKSYQDYRATLDEVRKILDAGGTLPFQKADFYLVLRPYFWFWHNPGFQDIYDTCERAMEVLVRNSETLFDKRWNKITGNPFLAIGTLLAGYLDDGEFDTSGWASRFASAEIASSVIAAEFAEKLESLDGTEADVQALHDLSNLMKDLEGAKHVAYWCLRHIGAEFVEALSIVHSLPTDDQSYILHALDAFPGDERVIGFYQDYIAKTKVESLKEQAQGYLEAVQGGAGSPKVSTTS